MGFRWFCGFLCNVGCQITGTNILPLPPCQVIWALLPVMLSIFFASKKGVPRYWNHLTAFFFQLAPPPPSYSGTARATPLPGHLGGLNPIFLCSKLGFIMPFQRSGKHIIYFPFTRGRPTGNCPPPWLSNSSRESPGAIIPLPPAPVVGASTC